MTEEKFGDVDAYIASFPPDVQAKLEAFRKAIRKAVPEAKEHVSYHMPAYDLQGRLLYFAGYKQHISLFAVTQGVLQAFGKELSRYEGTGRGTLRFPLDEDVPTALITKIAKLRAKENLSGKPRNEDQVGALRSPAKGGSRPGKATKKSPKPRSRRKT